MSLEELNYLEALAKKFDYIPSKNWSPELFIENSVGVRKDSSEYSFELKKKDEPVIKDPKLIALKNLTIRVTERRQLEGTFYERLEIHNFPIDQQELSVKLSTKKSTDQILIVENKSNRSYLINESFADQQQWDLFEHVQVANQNIEDTFRNYTRSQLVVSCFVVRKTGFYLYK